MISEKRIRAEMYYIVVDLEWNQSPTGRVIKNKNGPLPYEVIEIGAVKTDEDFNVISSFDRLVKPQVYLKMHKAVEKLLPLRMKDLQKGRHFTTVMNEFLNWCGSDVCFCTWGDADLLQLQRNMRYYGMDINFPWPFLYLDLQRIYSEQFMDGVQASSLSDAVDKLNIPKGNSYHRAIYDSEYTAQVAACLDKALVENHKSIDTYRVPSKTSEEIYLKNGDMEQYVTRTFDSREKASEYRELRSGKCFLCGETMEREVRWFCDNGRNYYAAFRCNNHGPVIGKFKIKKDELDKFYAVRTLNLSNESGIEDIVERRRKERERIQQKRYNS